MNILIPYDDSYLARRALQEACRLAAPHDRVTVMAAVTVPAYLPVDVSVEEVWKQTCAAERRLLHAQEQAEQSGCAESCRFVRVQARDRISAIMAGAAHYEATTILLAQRASAWRLLPAFFGDLNLLLRTAPCDVRVLYVTPGEREDAYCDHPRETDTVVRLSGPFQQPHTVATCSGSVASLFPLANAARTARYRHMAQEGDDRGAGSEWRGHSMDRGRWGEG